MELTGRPSFTVHDSCTHDRASRPLAGGVALTPCAFAPETRSAASNAMSAAARATGARPYLRDGGGCPDVFSMEPPAMCLNVQCPATQIGTTATCRQSTDRGTPSPLS